jgi:hypothetical protein
MAWPKGMSRKQRLDDLANEVNSDVEEKLPHGTIKTICDTCGHTRELHYGSKHNQCNSRDCLCERYA